jgi:hypothetical protein
MEDIGSSVCITTISKKSGTERGESGRSLKKNEEN